MGRASSRTSTDDRRKKKKLVARDALTQPRRGHRRSDQSVPGRVTRDRVTEIAMTVTRKAIYKTLAVVTIGG
jgi:hypothetical protein